MSLYKSYAGKKHLYEIISDCSRFFARSLTNTSPKFTSYEHMSHMGPLSFEIFFKGDKKQTTEIHKCQGYFNINIYIILNRQCWKILGVELDIQFLG